MSEPTVEAIKAAREVLHQAREADERREAERKRAFVGKFFRFLNSYSGGDKPWYLYVAVTAQDEHGTLTGLCFQHTNRGSMEIEAAAFADSVAHGGGYEEITPAQFRAALLVFANEVDAALLPPLALPASDLTEERT